MEVIPAIDLRAGRVVQLQQGDYAREQVFGHDPAAAAQRWVDGGASRIHVVDLDGARDGGQANETAIQSIVDVARRTGIPVQVGGGIRDLERVETVLGWGVARVILGTAALDTPDIVRAAAKAHPDCVILGVDARDGRVSTHGWKTDSHRTAREVLADFAACPLAGALYTDIARDGMLTGPNVATTEELARASEIPVIASGGVSSIADLVALAKTRVIAGAVVGTALYKGHVELSEAITAVASC